MRELQLGDSFSKVPPPEMESFGFAPRIRNRAAAAITVVVASKGKMNQTVKIVYKEEDDLTRWREPG